MRESARNYDNRARCIVIRFSLSSSTIKQVFYYQDLPYIPKVIRLELISRHYNDPFTGHFNIEKTREHNNAKNANTGHTLFELNYGYHSRVSFKEDVDSYLTSRSANKPAEELRELMVVYCPNLLHA